MVNNHGDRFRPQDLGLKTTPSKWPNSMISVNGGDPNYLLNGMILQVVG